MSVGDAPSFSDTALSKLTALTREVDGKDKPQAGKEDRSLAGLRDRFRAASVETAAEADGDRDLAGLREKLGRSPVPVQAEGDVRTLSADYDEHGFRWKSWRNVVAEAREGNFEDWPRHLPEGHNVTLDMAVNIERRGGDPQRWLQDWLRDRGVGVRERTAIEMRVLLDSVAMTSSTFRAWPASRSCFCEWARSWRCMTATRRSPTGLESAT